MNINPLTQEDPTVAAEYAGGPTVVADKGLTVYWDNITEESWNAGSRKVNCNLAALLPDRSGFAPVTGPVRGDVVVGDEPAPPATGTPDAPAQNNTSAPPSDGPPAEQIPTSTPTATPTSEPPAAGPPPGDAEPTRPTATTPPAPEEPERPQEPVVPPEPTPAP